MNERLYNLLPAIYRIRDAEQGEPLRALLGVIEEELRALEQDISGLYEDLFIETCDEWVIPYIGDLLGVHGMHPLSTRAGSLRSYVANTIAYRRRKGTAAVLEQIARDVTGWTAHAVEFFQLLAATQNMNHIRPACTTIDLHDIDGIELLGGAFERAAHTVDVRRIDRNGGRYNIPNIGIFLWRLQSYALKRSTSRKVGGTSDGKYAFYTFSPLGNDAPLFNQPQTEKEITHLAEEVNVPGMLRRRALREDLQKYREAIKTGEEKPDSRYFGDTPVFTVFDDGEPCDPEFLMICELSNWDARGWKPPESQEFKVAVDPVLGRLVFLTEPQPTRVEVSYSYGFSGDIGGGPYERELISIVPEHDVWKKTVSKQDKEADFKTLSDTLINWADTTNNNAIITIADSSTYELKETTIEMQAGKFLVIQSDKGTRPTLRIIDNNGNVATLKISGGNGSNSRLILNGLLIEGGIDIDEKSLGQLEIVHSTLVPGWSLDINGKPKQPLKPSITVADENYSLVVEIDHSVVGPLCLPPEIKALSVLDSIIDSLDKEEYDNSALETKQYAISDRNGGAGPSTVIERTTVFGKMHVKELTGASNAIFADKVTVDRRQQNCVRYSYVKDGSQTPRRYRCQPDLEIAKQIKTEVLSRLVPAFTSTRYGMPGYGQLHASCPEQIRIGADDGSEMGVFSMLQQPQRESNLHVALDEYLRFGLEAGIFYVDEDKEVYKDEKVY